MDQTVVLTPLLCVKCSAPLPAEPDQAAWVCPVCGQANYLDEEKGLQPVQGYYSTGIKPGAVGRPFWLAEGRVSVQRTTFGSAKNEQAQQFWAQPRSFFIPAYRASLEALLTRAGELIANPPTLQAGPQAHFEPVVLAMQDIQAAAEFIVVAIEAGRSDRLKTVDMKLQLSAPVLWILPE
jgi:predicted RNA-binding Zn-ribbon protein involved in translation (DUF1610 family)